MGIKQLCLIFGVVPSICRKVVNKMILLVVEKLRKNPIAKVKFPLAEKLATFAQLIQA